jgi:hypothetical protein
MDKSTQIKESLSLPQASATHCINVNNESLSLTQASATHCKNVSSSTTTSIIRKQGAGSLSKSGIVVSKYKSKYNSIVHKFYVGSDIIRIEFKLPPFNQFHDYTQRVKFDTSRRYYHVHARHNIRNTISSQKRTQGLLIPVTYLAEAATTIASTTGLYFLYRMFSDAKLALSSTTENAAGILDFLKEHLSDVIVVLLILARVAKGELGVADACLLVAGYAAGRAAFSKITSIVTGLIPRLVSIDSSSRHTQGKGDITTFAECVISVIGAYFLGFSTTDGFAKSLSASVKSLGSMLLNVKSYEMIIVTIIQHFPNILLNFISEKFPSLGLYVMMTSDEDFKKVIGDLGSLMSMNNSEIMYSSHYLQKFLSCHAHISTLLQKEDMILRGLDKMLSKQIAWCDQLYDACDEHGLLPGRRRHPYVIWIYGEAGIGKTAFAKQVANHFAAKLAGREDFDYRQMVYPYSTANVFFDGYNNQPVFILNDYLQFSSNEEEQWLIRLVDTMDVSLPVSTVDNIDQGIKGEVKFTSKVIIVTSNTGYLSQSPNIISVDAFNRRRNYLCEMSYKPDSSIDLDDFDFKWALFKRHAAETHGMRTPPSSPMTNVRLIGALDTDFERFCLTNSYISTMIDHSAPREYLTTLTRRNKLSIEAHSSVLDSYMTNIKGALEYSIHGLKLKYILPFCIAGGMYAGYKGVVSYLASKISQSLSGDVSTRRYDPKRKPLRKYAHGLMQNDDNIMHMASGNLMSVKTSIRREDKLLQQTMWGCVLCGTVLVTPKHLWMRGGQEISEGSDIELNWKEQQFNFQCERTRLYLHPSCDIAAYNLLGLVPIMRALDSHLLTEDTMISESGEEAIMLQPRPDSYHSVEVNAYLTSAEYIDPLGTTYHSDRMWEYRAKTAVGDCGSLLFIRVNGQIKLAGMHVAGDYFSGNSELLTQELLTTIKDSFKRVTQGFAVDRIIDEDQEFFDAISDFDEGFLFHGSVKRSPFLSVESEIVQGPFYEVLQPVKSGPAVLVPSDPRLEEVVSPILKSVAKYGQPIKPFNKTLMEKAFRIVQSFYDPLKNETLGVDSHELCINSVHTPYLEKLDLSTSPGYPWTVNKMRKSDLMAKDDKGYITINQILQDRLNACENFLSKNVMFDYMLTTQLKDERVSLEKIAIGKTRTFMNFPVEYNILLRKYFDSFINAETKHAFDIGTTVGVNIYSSEWNRLYNHLNSFNYHLDGDFKAFDGTIRPEFFILYARLINDFYGDEHGSKRDLLVQGTCFAPMFVLRKVYTKLQGNPSGSRLTTSFNSFVNRMYVVMSMLWRLPHQYHTITFFKENMKMFAHGDDHLIGFNARIREHWDGLILRDFMKLHNIDYTSSKKDQPLVAFCPLQECYYLKSHFVWDPDTRKYMCGLDQSVIQEMVSWQRDHSLVSTQMILDTCMRYAYFWGPGYFTLVNTKLRKHIKDKHLNLTLLDFIDLETEYRFSGQLKFEYV